MVKIPKVIPPRSVVRLIRADRDTPAWKHKIGARYRIGYYFPRDGLGTIWLVDRNGSYCETTDRAYLLKYFQIERLSKETDYFGVNRRPLGPLRRKGLRQDLRTRVMREKRSVRLPVKWPGKILRRFKWPITGHLQKLKRVFSAMDLSRRKQPAFHYFVWPDKMRVSSFQGNLDRLVRFLDKGVTAKSRSLRGLVKKQEIADWQILAVRSLRKPDLVWMVTHRIYFVTSGKYDIWPEYAIQRVGADKYLVWKWKP